MQLCRKWVEIDPLTNVYCLSCDVDLTPYYSSNNFTAAQFVCSIPTSWSTHITSWYLSWCKLSGAGNKKAKPHVISGEGLVGNRWANEPSSIRRNLGWRYWNFMFKCKSDTIPCLLFSILVVSVHKHLKQEVKKSHSMHFLECFELVSSKSSPPLHLQKTYRDPSQATNTFEWHDSFSEIKFWDFFDAMWARRIGAPDRCPSQTRVTWLVIKPVILAGIERFYQHNRSKSWFE